HLLSSHSFLLHFTINQVLWGTLQQNQQIKKELELDDIENGDLINLGDEESPISDGEVISVLWNHERQNYYVR
ncbi:hypothetical protein P7H98_13175, partial [Lactococcus lactis]|nr:hypothetical protein [Lactococcus lactis]